MEAEHHHHQGLVVVENEAELEHKVDAASGMCWSSKLKHEVSKDVPRSSQIRSVTVFSICQLRISFQLRVRHEGTDEILLHHAAKNLFIV